MLNPEILKPFFKYLDRTKKDISWEKMGLVENAPIEAVKAYEKFQKFMQEEKSKEDFNF